METEKKVLAGYIIEKLCEYNDLNEAVEKCRESIKAAVRDLKEECRK